MRCDARPLTPWMMVAFFLLPTFAAADDDAGVRPRSAAPASLDAIAQIRDGFLVLKGGQMISLANLPVGESLVIDVIVDVANPLPGGTTQISSQVDVTGSNFTTEPTDDPATPGDDDPTITGVLIAADLQITKTDGSATSVAGQQVTYTITATNAGPTSVTDAAVTDTFSAPLLSCTYTSVAAGGATGNTPAGAGNLSDVLSMPASSTVTYTVTCDIDPAATGNLSNTANISSAMIMDPNGGNNSATDTNTLQVQADLEITKTNGGTTSIPGGQTTYTIVATNQGPSTVTDAAVADTFPAILSGCTYTSVAAGGATGNTPAGAGDISDTLTLPPSASVTYTATCDIDADATGSLANTATISSALATETDAGDNSATDTDTLEVTADLEITKTNGGATSVPGGQTTYTIVATNQGPSTVTDAAVADTFPATLSSCTYTSVAAGGATGNTPAGAGDIADTLTLPPAASVTYTATCDIDPAATGMLANTATVSSVIATETDAGDNSATDTDTLEVTADLEITKTNGGTTSVPGGQTAYTIVASNQGPSTVTDAAVADTFPAILSGCTYTSVAAGGATGNTPAGAGDIADTLNLPPAASVTYTATCDIDAAATGMLANTATVSSVIATETDAGNNSATDIDTLEVTADLEITKDNGTTEVLAGGQTTYTIVVSNQGPSTVTDAAVADAFPAVLVNCTHTSVAAGGATGNTPAGAGNIADTLTLPPAASVTYTATCDIDPAATGMLTNTATVSSVIATETDAGDNSATDTDQVIGATDLRLEKVSDVAVANEGETVIYTITVTNDGPDEARNVVVTDTLPPDVTFVSTSGCAEDPAGVPTCSLGDLAALASAQYTVEVTVNPAPPASFTNTATVAADNVESDPANNTDDATVTTDAAPPQILSVSTDAGPLTDCDTLNAAITALDVVFSEAMENGGMGPDQADDPANYLLVVPGFNRQLETTACGPAVGDDRLVPITAVYAADAPMAGQATVTLAPAVSTLLRDDPYRLIACNTITDAGGNPLDGDGDGTGGDDFEIGFRVDRLNRFANGHFDCQLPPWQVDPPGSVQVSHSAEDFEASPDSGSAQAAFATEEMFGLSQCVELEASTNPARFSSRVRVDAAPGVQVVALRSCEFFDQAACGGNSVGNVVDALVLGDTGGAWQDKDPAFEFDVPMGTVSASCELGLDSLDDAVFDAFADNIYVGRGDAPIFDDDFESGDTTAWSFSSGVP